MILTNARLIFPDGIRDGLEVVVHDGKIDAIRPPARARGKDVVDLAGNYLAPGFVDLHVHGALGRDTMEASAEAFRAICDFHATGGTTSLLLTTATAPIEKLVEILSAVRDRRSSISAIADGHHVSPTLMKMLYRAKGPGGICLVTDATAGAGLPDESRFSLFGNDCLVEGGVCLLSDRSALAGSASRMIDLVRNMVHDVAVPLHEAVAMVTQNPARALGLEAKGRLRVGADADLVILSPDLEILRVFTGGDELASNRQ